MGKQGGNESRRIIVQLPLDEKRALKSLCVSNQFKAPITAGA